MVFFPGSRRGRENTEGLSVLAVDALVGIRLLSVYIDVLIQHRLLVFPRQIKNSMEDSCTSKKYCKIRMLEPCHLMKRFPCTIPGILGILLCRRNINAPYLAASKPVRTWLGIIELTLAGHRSPPTYTHRLTL